MENQPPTSNLVERSHHPIAVTLAHENPQSAEAEQINATYEAVSDLLTRDSAYTQSEITELEAIPNTTEIVYRASSIVNTLSNITREYEEKFTDNTTQKDVLEAIKNDDVEGLKKRGLDFGYVQLDEVMAAFLVGNPPIDIETVGPYLAAHLNKETDKLEIKMDNVPTDEAVGIQMAAIFKKLTHSVEGKVRIVALLDEFNNYASERGFTKEEQDAYIVATADLFGRAGVIEPTDEAGKDFLLLRESEQVNKVDDIVNRLQASGNGIVSNNSGGELIFKPNDEFMDSLKISGNRRKEFKKSGIVLKDADGKPLCQTLDAAGFLGDENKYLMHVVMLENHMVSQQDKVFTLLKALGITNEHKYHNIFFDAQNLPPEIIVYGIIKKLQTHVEKLVERLKSNEQPTQAIA